MLKKLTLVLPLFLSASSLLAQPQELRGTVTDSMCGKHHMMKNASAAECTRVCVKSGADYALVSGDKVYTLKGDKVQFDKLAGADVVVKGDVNGSVVMVKEIMPASH